MLIIIALAALILAPVQAAVFSPCAAAQHSSKDVVPLCENCCGAAADCCTVKEQRGGAAPEPLQSPLADGGAQTGINAVLPQRIVSVRWMLPPFARAVVQRSETTHTHGIAPLALSCIKLI